MGSWNWHRRRYLSGLVSMAFLLGAVSPAQVVSAKRTVTSSSRLGVLDSIVQEAIHDEQIPGAVLLVGHDGQVIYRKEFGERSLDPRREPMTVDTIFDLASLTKVVATTTAVMQLVERGQIRVNDPVAKYIPEFAENGKEEITIRELLTHYSGLPADLDLAQPWQGRETAFRMAYAEKPIYAPGSHFLYSDVNFIVLGALVERVSGIPLNEYCQKKIFSPLAMTHTRFLPPASWLPKIAPTQYDEHDKMLRGVVHDPTARRMGGVAGNAGLFSTADDLAKFALAIAEWQHDSVSIDDRKNDHATTAADIAGAARVWLGHRFSALQQSRRPAAGGIIRAHRVHRDFVVDRSHDPDVHHLAEQCGSSSREGKCGRPTLENCDGGGCGFAAYSN